MKATFSALALVLTSTLSFAATASDLKPLQAGTFVLGTHTVSVYYTVSGESYEVVTTIVPNGATEGAPIRLVGSLPPGEKQTVSIGSYGTTKGSEILELTHEGDLLSATLVHKEVMG